MTLREALEVLAPELGNELVVHANGFLSRESFALADRPANFYMIGSMGLASSIGLGLALSRPDRRVFVFDGDGNVLMNLGTLALAGALAPKNFFHLCFDNGAYASTGAQPTISRFVRLEGVARACGYRLAARVDGPASLRDTFRSWRASEGPAFLLVRIDLDAEPRKLPRVEHAPSFLAERFRKEATRT
ncbi:MAG: hypothetical protein KatS3mg076_2811 [Candidatus Binatia bacterium]|nr:MAG: hypothetical protein KatS3mg076_2811 [Candidatus Binatia bacterium]